MQQILSKDLSPTSYLPEDVKFMVISIMENGLLDTESFVRFPYFASRLRKVKMYLDSRRPSTIHELWVDRRDYRVWWMFWGGGCVLALMFVMLASLFLRFL